MVGNPYREMLKLKILENPQEMVLVENLQRIVWPGNETEIVPGHLLVTAAHNGGLVIGAYLIQSTAKAVDGNLPTELLQEAEEGDEQAYLIGFVFGFQGLYETSYGWRSMHCSHMLAVHPEFRSYGIGFALKRAQWQMVRRQEVDRIIWTYDPLLSLNAQLNIARLGAVCQTYQRNLYGEMRDGLNIGLPSDRFQVDWWINSTRVNQRLSKRPRVSLDLAHFLAAEAIILNPTQIDEAGFPHPSQHPTLDHEQLASLKNSLLLIEIPSDFQKLRFNNLNLALEWRLHSRNIFENLFTSGYLVTDFVYLRGKTPRSFYVCCHGDQTL